MKQRPDTHARLVRKPWQRALGLIAVALALAGAFALYQRADFLVMLADQAWSCF